MRKVITRKTRTREMENGGNREMEMDGNDKNQNGIENGNHWYELWSFKPVAQSALDQYFSEVQGHDKISQELKAFALTWWNSHKRTFGVEAAYAMNWVELMKLMTEVYCPRNEIQKMETEF
ncbi:hypothetical protein Tco_0620368 [Tanacetum coccineum]